mmetsp:Transcript_3581/g.10447  ORF Transcript_3581/g.10447 Transcript_3581/m.10447 type:complete len:207 (-) Transcript_3581:605-1225(-)
MSCCWWTFAEASCSASMTGWTSPQHSSREFRLLMRRRRQCLSWLPSALSAVGAAAVIPIPSSPPYSWHPLACPGSSARTTPHPARETRAPVASRTPWSCGDPGRSKTPRRKVHLGRFHLRDYHFSPSCCSGCQSGTGAGVAQPVPSCRLGLTGFRCPCARAARRSSSPPVRQHCGRPPLLHPGLAAHDPGSAAMKQIEETWQRTCV